MLVRYALERLLYRLSLSRHAERFVLKGAMLFSAWTEAPFRATGDLDLLGFGANSPEALADVFTEIGAIDVAPCDGLVFDTAGMRATALRLDSDYQGVNLRFDALLGRARLRMLIDVGFGDVVTPGPMDIDYPSLLGMARARLRAYPPETAIAEKLEALVSIGLATSRVKDLYDLWAIAGAFELKSDIVLDAIRATFARRGTHLPMARPATLTAAFSDDPAKQMLWRAFIKDRAELTGAPETLADISDQITAFVLPVLRAANGESAAGTWSPTARAWRG